MQVAHVYGTKASDAISIIQGESKSILQTQMPESNVVFVEKAVNFDIVKKGELASEHILNTERSENLSGTQNEPKSTGRTQAAEITYVFVEEEINHGFLKQEQQESECFHNTEVSSRLCTIKTEPDSHLEGQEPRADDMFVKEKMSLDVVKHEELEEVEIILLKTENVHEEELNHTEPFKESQSLIDGTRRKQLCCELCGKKFSQKRYLQLHMRVHTGEKPFSCDFCNKKFSLKRSLRNHVRAHTGETPLYCNICNKTFFHKSSLHNHVQVHSGDKPFSCDTCSKTFNQKGQLQVHLHVHTGEKPFSCEVCNKNFSQKSKVSDHMRAVHYGEKRFSCDICNKTFFKNSSIQNHLRIHTGEKPFSCDICNKTFSQKGSLQKHMHVHNERTIFF